MTTDLAAEKPLEARAILRGVRCTPRKLRILVDLVRGMPVVEARRILYFSGKGGAELIIKTLDSAVANSENGPLGVGEDELYISTITVDEGQMLKRWRARARGRAYRVRKRLSHLSISVAEIPEES